MSANVYQFDLQTRGWFPHDYAVRPVVIYPEEGEALTTLLMGGADGAVHYMGRGTSDEGVAISCDVLTPAFDLGDPRAQKLWLDLMLDADPADVTLSLQPQMNNGETLLATRTVDGSDRIQTPLGLADTSLELYRNMALEVTWSSATATPILFEFEPNALLQPFLVRNVSTQFLSHGYTHFGHLRDAEFVYISTEDITLEITPNDDGPQVTATITLPSSAGVLAKQYIVLPVIKGKMFRYNTFSDAEFVLFPDETLVRTKEWGGVSYRAFYPFIGQAASNQVGG